MNKLSIERRAQILGMMVEGNSIRAIVRMTEGVKWLIDVAPDVEGFFAEHPVPQGTTTLAQHLERLRVNVALRDRQHAALAAALSS